jgi:hypothetical protein
MSKSKLMTQNLRLTNIFRRGYIEMYITSLNVCNRLRSNRNMAQVLENEQLLMKTYSFMCQVTSPKMYDFEYESCSEV